MQTVTVVAVRDFIHARRRYKRGDTVTMTAIEAAVESQARNVSLRERTGEPALGESIDEPEPSSERIYERKDLISDPAPSLEPSRRGRRGRTRRTDMVPNA